MKFVRVARNYSLDLFIVQSTVISEILKMILTLFFHSRKESKNMYFPNWPTVALNLFYIKVKCRKRIPL